MPLTGKWAILPAWGQEHYDQPQWAAVYLSPELMKWLTLWRGIAMAIKGQSGFHRIEFFEYSCNWYDYQPEETDDRLDDRIPYLSGENPAESEEVELSVSTVSFDCDGSVYWEAYPCHVGHEYQTGILPMEVFFDE